MIIMQLKATIRIEFGRKVKTLRRAGFLPAVLYGSKILTQALAVSYKDFEKVYKEAGESTLLKLEIGGETHDVLIYDVSRDPLRGLPLHADFYAVQMDKEIRAKVPVEFFGESMAVKNEGGVLVKVVQELEVEALPQELPHGLRIDLSLLSQINDRVLVKNIILPKGVKILAGEEETVAIVEAPRSEKTLTSSKETVVSEAPVEVKTEQELKRAARLEKKEASEEGGMAGRKEKK